MSNVEELLHILKQAASQESNSYRPFIYGHISTYDPGLHRVRVIFPSLSDGNGGFVVSGWMPLGTMAAGDGFGVQVIPYGGATQANPTAGEQCKVAFFDKNKGLMATPCQFFNNEMVPPSAAGAYASGDVVLVTSGGAQLVLKGNGSAVTVKVNAGVVNITAPTINVGSNGETLQEVVLKAAWTYLTGHTHSGCGGTSPSGPPIGVPTTGVLTSALNAG